MQYLITIIIIVSIMCLWAFVQIAWRNVFPDVSNDPDVLAGRGNCQGCSCKLICKKKLPFQKEKIMQSTHSHNIRRI